jgi:hypothetical protein
MIDCSKAQELLNDIAERLVPNPDDWYWLDEYLLYRGEVKKMKWRHLTFNKGITVSDEGTIEKKPKPKPEPLIAKSQWRLNTGKTVVFYNGHPEFDIVAGAKGEVVAEYYGPACNFYSMMMFDYKKPSYRGLLVKVGGKMLEVNESLVRVVVKAKKKKRK